MIHSIKGMNDILPPESGAWHRVESIARAVIERYGYEEIRTPVLEEAALFSRTVGETSNIVEKEMYSFQDKDGKFLALRPEGTAGVVRAYIESGRAKDDPFARFFYIGPMYRRERPQKGRYRQFYQIGAEFLGTSSPLADAEVIHMLDVILDKMVPGSVSQVPGSILTLQLNSLGCPLCRPKFHKVFLEFLEKNRKELCPDCQRRIDKNPLRALDCKNEGCVHITKDAPSIQDHLCDECEKHFDQVLEGLGVLGSKYTINPRIVRGLDYYQRTAFEFVTDKLGAQNAVAAGGRYDGLVHLLGGPHIPGIGWAIGLERLIELIGLPSPLAGEGHNTSPSPHWGEGQGEGEAITKVFLAPIGDKALREAFRLSNELRKSPLPLGRGKGEGERHPTIIEMDYDGKSLKSQMRRADRLGAKFVVIIGDAELAKGVALVRNMSTKEQKEVPLKDLATIF